MCYLEPPDQPEIECTECGEQENIQHHDGATWLCFSCGQDFSDGTDSDGSEFEPY